MRAIINRLFAFFLCLGVFYVILFSLLPITSSIGYPALRKEWTPAVVTHFPTEVLPGSNIRGFIFTPGWGQGGTMMQLRVHFRADQYEREVERLGAIPVTDEGRIFGDGYKKFSEGHLFFVADPPIRLQAENVFVIHARPGGYEAGMEVENGSAWDWNHGTACGYSLDRAQSEVIYWVESW